MSMSIKLGLIGGGYWGQNLIRDFHSLKVLHTVCDVNEEALSRYREMYPGLKTTTKWSEVLGNREITAVCVSLPADIHYTFCKEALLAGKDVYVEKPITLDVEEAKILINLADQQGKILMVGHILHYHPAVEKIKSLVEQGKIGRIKNIISNRLNLGKFRTSENVLWSFAPHDISIVLALCGNRLPDRVQSTGKDFVTKGVHDITNTVMSYDSEGIYVNINVNWLNPYKEQKMVIIGDAGMILFDDTLSEGKLRLYPKYIEWGDTVPAQPNPIKSDGEVVYYEDTGSPLLRECQHFVDCCRDRSVPITDGREGLRVLQVLNSSHKSLTNGGVSVPVAKEGSTTGYFSHHTAIVDQGAQIGAGTNVWHYTHVSKNSKIGDNCSLGQNVFVAPGAVLGNNCRVQNNVSIYDGVVCEDGVFLGPSCVLTNVTSPRAEYGVNGNYVKTLIKQGATVGANATIVCGRTLGRYCLVGAGAVVTKDVPDNGVVVGNPAKLVGRVDDKGVLDMFK